MNVKEAARRVVVVENTAGLFPTDTAPRRVSMVEPTASPYWHQTGVTRIIRDARDSKASADDLLNLVLQPALTRLRRLLDIGGYASIDIIEEDVFSRAWMLDLCSALKKVEFNDRYHFMNLLLMRCRNRVNKLARVQRARLQRQSEADVTVSGGETKDLVAQAEEIARALDKLETLELPLREAIYVNVLEGNSLVESAKVLGVSPSTVHRRVERGVQALRQQLE